MDEQPIITDEDDSIDGEHWMWIDNAGRMLFEEDVRLSGERWRIHQSDKDPRPSDPHAHCYGGKHLGQKLDLYVGQLYQGTRATGKYLAKRDFIRLCEYAAKKFPEIDFPLLPPAAI